MPIADIDHCWTLLKNHLTTLYPSASTTTIINYLESMQPGSTRSTQYPRDMWSMYQSVLDNDPRTNNVSEGGNNAINTAAGCSHPTIIPFVKILQRYNAEQEAKINQFNTTRNPNRRLRARTACSQEDLQNCIKIRWSKPPCLHEKNRPPVLMIVNIVCEFQ